MKRLHSKAGKSAIHPENAVQALGYSGINGAALGILAALRQYGLLDSQRGTSVAVSPLAIKLIHPLNAEQEAESRRIAALSPKIFNDLYSTGYFDCAVDVLANHLIQSGFTPDGARKAASIFKENAEFANLTGERINADVNSAATSSKENQKPGPVTVSFPIADVIAHPSNVTKEFSFPLDDENEVELKFLGTRFGPDLLDELEAVIKFLKTRFKKKQADFTKNAKPHSHPPSASPHSQG